MNSTVDLVVAVLIVVIVGISLATSLRQRSKRHAEAVRQAREHVRLTDELKQKRDHQFNHGGRILKWLKDEIKPYADLGFDVLKIRDSGDAYSIHIVRRHESTIRGFDDILHLSYDFVRYQEPYLGHVHYGTYGPDILIWVGDHAPEAGLKELVLDYVAKRAEHLRHRDVA